MKFICKNCRENQELKRINQVFCNQKCSKAWHKRQYYQRNKIEIGNIEKVRRKKISQSPINRMFKNAKNRSSLKGLPFNIQLSDITIPDICPVLGIKIKAGDKFVGDCSPTLDKIVPSLGYVKGNIRVISHRANRLKCDATVEEIEMILTDLKNIYNGRDNI